MTRTQQVLILIMTNWKILGDKLYLYMNVAFFIVSKSGYMLCTRDGDLQDVKTPSGKCLLIYYFLPSSQVEYA